MQVCWISRGEVKASEELDVKPDYIFDTIQKIKEPTFTILNPLLTWQQHHPALVLVLLFHKKPRLMLVLRVRQ